LVLKTRIEEPTKPEGACYCKLSEEDCRKAGHYKPLSRLERIAMIAGRLVEDIRARHPGEQLTRPHFRALHEALHANNQ